MFDKVFFVEPWSETRKTYGDLLSDVCKIELIPKFYFSESYYELLTMLVAAIYGSAELSLSQSQPVELSSVDSTHIAPKHCSCTSEFLDSLHQSTCKIGVFTSGTTGRPRWIQHQLNTLMRSVRVGLHHQDDIWGLTYHPASFAGLQVILQALFNQNTIVSLRDQTDGDAHSAITNNHVTHISATPTWIRLFCSDGVCMQQIRHVTTGGEIASHSLVEQIKIIFPLATFRNVYASSECGSLLISEGDVFRVPESLADKVKVDGGILTVHHSLLADSIQRTGLEGFHLTGDCVEVLSYEPLTFRFTARRTDWINVGGSKVNPHEIERLLVSVEGISDARVFGRKNSVTGNIVCCEIVRCGDELITPKDIRQRLEKVVEPFMIPRIFDFVDSIEKTPSGKKNRSE